MTPLSVGALTLYIKQCIDEDTALQRVSVTGELSNYKIYNSGHHYFTLKDADGVLKCVCFKNDASSLRFVPHDGMKVVANGRISVYPRDGVYQLYCRGMEPDGLGALTVAFEQLKRKLSDEGLFDESRKKKLPKFPNRIVLITSPSGDAVRDMQRILGARWPLCELILLPVRVQGAEAPGEIAAALSAANRQALGDVIITGRGGGSLEDLWAFNEEIVAREIAASEIPVISAVGHEPDVTIADYVADLRASTPSNAAELAVPDQFEWRDRLAALDARLPTLLQNRLHRAEEQLLRLTAPFTDPSRWFADRQITLDRLSDQLGYAWERSHANRRADFSDLAARLDALSPLKVLSRGYAVCETEHGALQNTKHLNIGELVRIRLAKGSFDANVTQISP